MPYLVVRRVFYYNEESLYYDEESLLDNFRPEKNSKRWTVSDEVETPRRAAELAAHSAHHSGMIDAVLWPMNLLVATPLGQIIAFEVERVIVPEFSADSGTPVGELPIELMQGEER